MMQNRKVLTLVLAVGLLAFWTHGSAHSQTDEASRSSTPSLKSAADIWTETLPSVVYIIAGKKNGSGVLVQLQPRVVLTNAHVIGELDNVTVYFPAYHLKGQLIRERDFYVDKRNHNLLKVLGYTTNGRVIATDRESDVAIIILEGIPATAKPIKADKHYDYARMKKGEPVHILGNPGNRSLWQWDPGFFQQHNGQRLTLAASVYYGNSGGPVVDQSGILIGLASAVDFETETYVVPLKPIIDLVDKVKEQRIFSIANNTEYTVDYEIKWSDSSDWDKFSLEPGSEPRIHEKEVKSFQSYPTIRYRDAPESQDNKTPKDSTEIPEHKTPSEESTIATEHALYTNFRHFGSNFKERINIKDSFPYRFDYDSEKKKIKLRLPRETAYIHNKTDNEVEYFVQATRRERPKDYTLEPNQWRIHWFDKPPTEEILYNYPRIRFNNMTPTDVIDESTDDTVHFRIYTDKKLRTATEFLNFDFKGLSVNSASSLLNTEGNYYHFGPHREAPDLIDLHPSLPSTPASSEEGGSRKHSILDQSIGKRSILGWIQFVCLAIITGLLLFIGHEFIVSKIFPPKRPIFLIQNNTEATVDYQVKWTENEDWDPYSLEPGQDSPEWYDGSPKEIRSGYPKIRFDSIVNDKKEIQEHTLETYTRRFRLKTAEKIGREQARHYYFELDSENHMLNLVDSEKSD